MSFADFIERYPRLCQCLQQAKAKQRSGQAYLLVGDTPSLLEDFAMAWAQTAACIGEREDGAACGECQPCQLFQMQAYPECFILRPQSKSRTITVDSMRQFDHDLSLAASPNRLKIGIIIEAECMGAEAQNAFLKTLEEPPRRTMLLLLTVNSRLLLPTIRSRCQLLSLLRNRQDYSLALEQGLFTVLAGLRRNAGASVAVRAASKISAILAGLRSAAEEASKQDDGPRWQDLSDAKVKKQLEDEQSAKVEAEYIRYRDSLLDAMQAWFLQRLLIANGAAAGLLPHPEMLADAAELLQQRPNPQETEEDLILVEEFVRALRSNVEERLALDAMCLSICEKIAPRTQGHTGPTSHARR
jgi:DNA polymerase-3 subunit delta'